MIQTLNIEHRTDCKNGRSAQLRTSPSNFHLWGVLCLLHQDCGDHLHQPTLVPQHLHQPTCPPYPPVNIQLLPEHPGGGLGVGLVVGHQCPEAPTWDQGIRKITFINDNWEMLTKTTLLRLKQNQTIEPSCQNVMTAEGVPLTCTGVAQVAFLI